MTAPWDMWIAQPTAPAGPSMPYIAGIAISSTPGVITDIIAPKTRPPASPPATPALQSPCSIETFVAVAVSVAIADSVGG